MLPEAQLGAYSFFQPLRAAASISFNNSLSLCTMESGSHSIVSRRLARESLPADPPRIAERFLDNFDGFTFQGPLYND